MIQLRTRKRVCAKNNEHACATHELIEYEHRCGTGVRHGIAPSKPDGPYAKRGARVLEER